MKNFFLVLTFSVLSTKAFSFEALPKTLEVLVAPSGPVVVMELGAIEFNKLKLEACSSLAKYEGDAVAKFGDQTYNLILVETLKGQFCPSDSNFDAMTNLVLHFKNVKFGNGFRLLLIQENFPFVAVVTAQGVSLPGKILK